MLLWPFYEKDRRLDDLLVTHTYGVKAVQRASDPAIQSLLHTQLAEMVAEAELREGEPSTTVQDYLPAVIRICGVTLVGAFVGAPLVALAVQESIWMKVVDAGIATGIGSIVMEFLGPLSEKVIDRHPELRTGHDWATHLSGIDVVLGMQDRAPGRDLGAASGLDLLFVIT